MKTFSLRAAMLAAVACAAAPSAAPAATVAPAPEPPAISVTGQVNGAAAVSVKPVVPCDRPSSGSGIRPRAAAPDCGGMVVNDPCRIVRRNVAADHIAVTRYQGDEVERAMKSIQQQIVLQTSSGTEIAATDASAITRHCVRVQESSLSYYMQTYEVSAAEAERRLALQASGVDLEPALIEEFGRGFTQIWFDNDAGRWVVAISPRADEAAVREFLEERGLGGSEIVRRHYDHVQLHDALDRLNKRLGHYPGHLVTGIGEDGLSAQIASDDPAHLKEEVRGAVRDAGVHALVTERAGTTFAVAPRQACANGDCDRLIAGVRTGHAPRGDCTAGFYVGSDVTSHPFMLSAGHCTEGTGRWSGCAGGGCWEAGGIQNQYFGNGYDGDAALLRLDDWAGFSGRFHIYEGYVNWWNHGVSTLRKYWSQSAPAGIAVCHNGIGIGSACGTIRNNWTNPTIGGRALGGMIEVVNTCGAEGDSGGPWTMEYEETAVGLESGGGPGNGCGTTEYVEPVHRPLQLFGVKIYGRP